jgi:phosphonate transport system substrate-binding protein
MAWLTRSIITLMAFIVVNSACAAESTWQKPLILAVHPYLPKDEIISRFTPLANYIAHSIGRPVEVRIGRDYEEHIDAIGTDSVDIAYMGAVPYVKLVAKYGKKPLLVRQEIDGQQLLKGEIIVRQDSPLQSLSELKGKRFIFTDPDSTMGAVIPQKVLIKAGIPLNNLASYKFVEGHDNVALAVLAGDYDAGAVKEETFQKYAPKGLRALAHLPSVYDHVFVTSTKLSPEIIDSLRSLLLQMKSSQEGRSIMTQIHPKMTAFVIPSDSEYDNLRTLMGLKILTNPR